MAVTRLVAMAMKMPSHRAGILERSRRDGVLERSFETDAEVGRVECSGRGCRPVYEEEELVSQVTMASCLVQRGANVRLVHQSMFHAAMQDESHDSSAFAAFSWKSLSDEELLQELSITPLPTCWLVTPISFGNVINSSRSSFFFPVRNFIHIATGARHLIFLRQKERPLWIMIG